VRIRTLVALAVVAGGVGMAMPAQAEDAKALIKKVESRLYYPQDHGLKDLCATLVLEGGGGGPMQSMSVKIFWKAPDKKACRVDLPDEVKSSPMGAMVQGMMEKAVDGIVSVIVPMRLGQEELYEYTVEADGDLTKIVGKRKPDVKDKAAAEEVTMWVDAKATPVKMVNVVNGQRTEMADLKFEEKDGKLLMSTVSVAGSGGGATMKGMTMKLEYTQVDSIWLAKSATMEGKDGKGGGYTVKDHAVNKGVDDAVFIRKPAPVGGAMFPGAGKKKDGAEEQ
jgi:hypothetical protein